MTAFLASGSVNGRAYLAPAVIVATPPVQSGPSAALFLAPQLANGRRYLAPHLVPSTPPEPSITASVRFDVLPRRFGETITHYTN